MNLATERLSIRPFVEADAAFILELLNDADWLRFIGDKQVNNLDDARRYLQSGPLAMQERYGHSLGFVERRSDGAALGMCGLVRRDALVDITDIDNHASARVLEAVGFRFERELAATATSKALRLFAIDAPVCSQRAPA